MSTISSSWLSICVLSLTWACSQQALAPASAALTSCNYQLDVVFAVDLSNSINRPDFSSIKSAMVTLIGGLRVSEDDIHVGLVTFSSIVTQFPLSGDKDRITAMINSFVFLDGSTQTQAAINVATNLFADKARGGNVRKLLIVITDGRSDNPSMTLDAANNAKRAGISIYTVGVGSKVIEQELQLVASSRNQVFRSENFQDLGNVLVQATSTACTQTCTYGRFDLAFVLDNSPMENTQEYFRQVKNFVKNILVFPDVDSGNVRVSVLTYSHGGYLQFALNAYDNKIDMIQAIENIQYTPGFANPSSVLQGLRTAVFTENSGDRPNVPNVVVMVTKSLSEFNHQKTIDEAKLARTAGIYIYGVAIGADGAKELSGIVTSPVRDNLLFAEDIYHLDDIVPVLMSKMDERFCPSTLA